MAFKLNIADPSKSTSWKLESEADSLVGKKLGETVAGKELSADLEGYELVITGASDFAGFAHKANIEGTELRRVLLQDGWGMHKKPKKEGKKPVSTPNGLRLRKTYRGNTLSDKTVQINLSVQKPGKKSFKEIFPEQNKAPEKEKTAETSADDKVKEEIKEEVKEEIKDSIPSSPETKTPQAKEEAAEKVAEEVAEEVEEAAAEAAEENSKKE